MSRAAASDVQTYDITYGSPCNKSNQECLPIFLDENDNYNFCMQYYFFSRKKPRIYVHVNMKVYVQYSKPMYLTKMSVQKQTASKTKFWNKNTSLLKLHYSFWLITRNHVNFLTIGATRRYKSIHGENKSHWMLIQWSKTKHFSRTSQ